MPRERQNPRAVREALANDRLRTALDVMSTLDGMRVRQEQLDMARGEQEARADMNARQAAALELAAEKQKADLWRSTRQDTDTSGLLQTFRTVDLDDSDAVEVLNTGRANYTYAGEQEKSLVDKHLIAATARREEFRENERKYGIRAEDYMVPVEGAVRPDGTPVRRLDRKAYGHAQTQAIRALDQYRGSLKDFEDVERFDTLIGERRLNPQQAQQVMERHDEVRSYLRAAAELGIDSNLIAAASKAGQINVRSQKSVNTLTSDVPGDSGDPLDTSTSVFVFGNFDNVKNTSINGGPTLGSLVNDRIRLKAQVGEAKAVATDRSKALQGLGDALRLVPEAQRAVAAKAFAKATGIAAAELLQAGEAERNLGNVDPQDLRKNTAAADAAGAEVLDALQPTSTKTPANPADAYAQTKLNSSNK